MTTAVIFDMDGLIIDSEPIHFEVDIETVNRFGARITHEELERFVGMTNPEMWKLIKDEYKLGHSVEEIIDVQLAAKIRLLEQRAMEPIDGIRELLDGLKANKVPIGLASSSPRSFIMAVLNKFGIAAYFDCVVSGEEVARGKPAPDVFLEAASMLGVPPESCIVVEDSRNGVAAAKAAGMKCYGFVNPNSGNQDLSAADWIVDSIRAIKPV
ncbi:HAD family hydrolase [Paenibacillaceae bacterium WGS1546]|uniref:HAD family hydrolase n=1 Tax=Cohnella sp. WGS1546 TaxID=3366810 RepID=UPI00372D2DE3